MSISLTDARLAVRFSSLHTGTTFVPAEIDESIKVSGNRLLRESRIMRKTGTVDTVVNQNTVPFLDAVPDFLPGYLTSVIYISSSGANQWRPLRQVAFGNIRSERDRTEVTDEPEMVAWLGNEAHVFPTPDAVYILRFAYCAPLTPWRRGAQGDYAAGTTYQLRDWVTSGGVQYEYINATGAAGNAPPNTTYWKVLTGQSPEDPDVISVNMPDQVVDEFLNIGPRAYLLMGAAHSHPDAYPAMAAFTDMIQRVKGTTYGSGVYYDGDWLDNDTTYGPVGRL